MAVAALSTPYGCFHNMVALSSFCELLPQEMTVYKLYSPTNKKAHAFFAALGVPPNDVVPSNHARTWLLKKDPLTPPHPSGLSFNYFFGTARAWIAGLAYLTENQSESMEMQKATVSVLTKLLRRPGVEYNLIEERAGYPNHAGRRGVGGRGQGELVRVHRACPLSTTRFPPAC